MRLRTKVYESWDRKMTQQYETPLSSRYASKYMLELFSSDTRYRTWRRLWVSLAKAEMELGLPVTQEQVDELAAHIEDIDYDCVREREKEALSGQTGGIPENCLSTDVADAAISLFPAKKEEILELSMIYRRARYEDRENPVTADDAVRADMLEKSIYLE